MCTKFNENRSMRRLFLCCVKLFLIWCEEKRIQRKSDEFWERISHKLLVWFLSNFIWKVVYMQSIKYVEIGCIFKIWKAGIGEYLVCINNTLVYARIFLATRPCVLITFNKLKVNRQVVNRMHIPHDLFKITVKIYDLRSYSQISGH